MLLTVPDAYRKWAPLYDSYPNPLLALERRVVGDLIKSIPACQVLDIGCGTGRSMRIHPTANTFGVDISPEMLEEAMHKDSLLGKLVLADVCSLPFKSGVADISLCSFALSYFPDL